jgi:hypothetical protein
MNCLHKISDVILALDLYIVPLLKSHTYRLADNSRPVSFTVRAWEWVYAKNLPPLQRYTREGESSKQHVGAHSVLNVRVVTETKQFHRACSPILGSPTCVWQLRNVDPAVKVCRPTYSVQLGRRYSLNIASYLENPFTLIYSRFILDMDGSCTNYTSKPTQPSRTRKVSAVEEQALILPEIIKMDMLDRSNCLTIRR